LLPEVNHALKLKNAKGLNGDKGLLYLIDFLNGSRKFVEDLYLKHDKEINQDLEIYHDKDLN
jgi:hypothetical protein